MALMLRIQISNLASLRSWLSLRIAEVESKYIITNSENIEIKKNEGSIYIHEMQIDVNEQQFNQRCFYKCKSNSGVIMSCLTASISRYKNKIEIFDLITDFMFSDKYNIVE